LNYVSCSPFRVTIARLAARKPRLRRNSPRDGITTKTYRYAATRSDTVFC
jgi:hypothetical protein